VPPLQTVALTTFTGTPGLIAVGLFEVFGVDWLRIPARAWGALAYSSLLSLIVAYLIWNTSVQKVGSSRTAIYMCLTPLIAAGVAWLTLGERLVPLQGAGAVFIVSGVLMTRKA
jgi:drug/metabolite transporter (DMT)-like permease